MNAALFVGLGLSVLLFVALDVIDRVDEAHHGYYGIVLVAVAAIFHSLPLAIVGDVLLADDDVQHTAEMFGLVPRMADFTPIHRLGAWLMSLDLKNAGMWLPLSIGGALFLAAVFCAVHFGV